MKILMAALLISLVSGCAFYPKAQQADLDNGCDLYFKKLTMDVTSSRIQCQGGGNSAGTCIVLAGVVAGGTAVVSGSIVLVGNTLHWLEKQGKCDDSFLNTRVFSHNKPLLEEEGMLVEEAAQNQEQNQEQTQE